MADERIIDQAYSWVTALQRDDADWDGFTRWLETAPEHRQAFDSVALLDGALDRHRHALADLLPEEAANDQGQHRWWAIGGGVGALAAAAAAALIVLPSVPPADRFYDTGPGETRRIALADGSAIQLASASRLAVRDNEKHLVLEGTATFDVPHRPDRTLVVQAGGLTIQDLGTRFDVSTGGEAVRVAVAEGRVSVAGPELAAPVRLSEGKRVIVDRALGVADVRASKEFASWQHGRLVYDAAPLPLVAAEVSRYAGQRVALGPGLSNRRFSGVLKIGSGLVDDLAHLMDLEARGQGSTIWLVARDDGR